MKLLTLIRHAKSSWKHPGLTDFERPLNARGERDAPRMARRFAAAEPRPDLLLASSAERAERTARSFAAAIGMADAEIGLERALYLASPSGLLEAVREVDDAVDHLALVAHNPGITDFLEILAGARIDNLPTCGVARLRLDIDSWSDVAPGCGQLLDLDTPKRKGHQGGATGEPT
jgi:phosphohistidine phosphatase